MLAILSELGPITRYRRLQVQLTAVGELMDAGGGESLGAGEHCGESVLLPRAGACCVSRAAPQVDDEVAFDPHGNGCADLVPLRKVTLERVAYSDEVRRA